MKRRKGELKVAYVPEKNWSSLFVGCEKGEELVRINLLLSVLLNTSCHSRQYVIVPTPDRIVYIFFVIV